MKKDDKNIAYIFETSWEVCNKIGGIYTVLSSQAKELQNLATESVIYIGPDFGDNKSFKESKTTLKAWKNEAKKEGLNIRIGKWEIPGSPIAVLVDHKPFFAIKNEYFGEMWQNFGVNSLHAYGDYDESVIFGYAAAKVVESFANFHKKEMEGKNVIASYHEWTTGSGLLYTKAHNPNIKTIFTTHATTTGRSICFNNKPLYDYFEHYNGDQMAGELNVEAKHSIEKMAAHNADCFTTVSDITARECAQILDKAPDVVTPNGFEPDFVPSDKNYDKQREDAKKSLRKVSEALLGYKLPKNTLFIATSGRYEYKNKGIDVYLDALKQLEANPDFKGTAVAFVMVPAWIAGPREDLKEKLETKSKVELNEKNFTHALNNHDGDNVLNSLWSSQLDNSADRKVKVIFVPSYLAGNDGIFNKSYYDLLIGLDMTVFASYYEPWGYTPHESAAFGIPSITTDLAGFGKWVSAEPVGIENGVAVLHRTDSNYQELAGEIQKNILAYSNMSEAERAEVTKKTFAIAKKGEWKEFIKYVKQSFEFALKNK
ncbi:MAG: glycogen/starch synthase [Paludibacteraceae bacterium]|nr:glycogen/starch synthase [Paludibacteraceae bacterium]